MSTKHTTYYELNQDIAVVRLNNPPVNALSLSLRLYINDAIYAALADEQVTAMVIIGAENCFSSGGDIKEFDQAAITQAPFPAPQFQLIENSPKPIVAAMHGFAVGGGLELAMSCHARVVQSKTKVGLPEVNLGLIPGATGTQRLPRLVGPVLALNMVVSGKSYQAADLKDVGLFDIVTDNPPLEEAILLARELVTRLHNGESLRRTADIKCNMENSEAFFAYAKNVVKAKFKGLPAPSACVDCIEFSTILPFNEGIKRESEVFSKLRTSPEFLGLRHTFQATNKSSSIESLPTKTECYSIEKIAVVGGGTMGRGIIMSIANAGLSVILLERDQVALDNGLKGIQQEYDKSLKRGRLSQQKVDQRMSLIKGELSYDALANVDLVIEAVFENLQVKREVFEALSQVCKPQAILASNTSMLDLDEIAKFTNRPEQVIGLHFFSPAHIMKLLEVVKAAHTSNKTLASAMAFAKKIRKTAVVAKVCEGFIGNRMIEPYLMQAGMLLDEGALPAQIDRAIEKWGMAMGPFRMSDLAGNDLHVHIRKNRLAKNPALVYSKVFDKVAEMGRFGQKTNKGWYNYIAGQRKPQPSEEVNRAVIAESKKLGLSRRTISDDEIVDRLLLALINEGAKILEDKVAQRASDIDVVYVAGYGFPAWAGGPMFQADSRGLQDIIATMRRFSNGPEYQNGTDFWRPADLLCRLAENGQSFSNI